MRSGRLHQCVTERCNGTSTADKTASVPGKVVPLGLHCTAAMAFSSSISTPRSRRRSMPSWL
jgi:hypothetical protein